MRNIATCYSEHAVRVSDSYCSGPLNKSSSSSSYVSPKSIPTVQTSVTQTFKSVIGDGIRLFAAVTWCNKLSCRGFLLNLSHTNKFPKTGNRFEKPEGNETIEFDGNGPLKLKSRVIWDLTSARFESGPEPLGSFYVVVILIESRIALLMGDMEDDAIVQDLIGENEIRSLSLMGREEHLNGQWSSPILTRVRFGGSGREHEVTIKCDPDEDGPRNPVLWVSVDKKKVVRVRRLPWNFRGNQVIFVDGLLVDVMWDVFGWFFEDERGKNSKNGKNCGLFMLRTRSGLDSRLWMDEEHKKFGNQDDKPEFSLLISVSTSSSKSPAYY